MILLNRRIETAIKIVENLQSKNYFVTSQTLANELKESKFVIEQIVRNLGIEGIIEIKSGPNGGSKLKSNLVSVYQIATALGETFELNTTNETSLELYNELVSCYKNKLI